MEVKFARATEIDALELLPQLLPEDRDEILAMGFDLEWGMVNSVRGSEDPTVARLDGRIALMMGVTEPIGLSNVARPWMLASDLILQHRLVFLRFSRLVMREYRSRYPLLENYVDARHERAVTWLRWLGAAVDPAEPFGPFRRPFHKFTFEGSSNVR